VTFISPVAEFTPRNVQPSDERAKLVYRVKITLANPEGIFKPGQPADAFLVKDRRRKDKNREQKAGNRTINPT